jgi:hypothetical protein
LRRWKEISTSKCQNNWHFFQQNYVVFCVIVTQWECLGSIDIVWQEVFLWNLSQPKDEIRQIFWRISLEPLKINQSQPTSTSSPLIIIPPTFTSLLHFSSSP